MGGFTETSAKSIDEKVRGSKSQYWELLRQLISDHFVKMNIIVKASDLFWPKGLQLQLIDSKPLCWTQVGRGVDGFDAGHHRDQGHDPHQEHHGQVGGSSCLSSPKVRLCDVEKEEYDHLDWTIEQRQCSPGSLAGWIRHETEARRRKAASVAAAHLFPLCPPSPSL